MTFRSNGKIWKTVLRNAAILGGIATVSNWGATMNLTLQGLWAGIIAGLLIALIELKHAYGVSASGKRDPKHQKSYFLP